MIDRAGPLVLVSASANPHKVEEMAAILRDRLPSLELRPRPSQVGDVVEDAGTLEGNARLKARAILAATGLPAVADDTGLFVDALDGAPGVETAYFAGPDATDEENRARLLAELARVGALGPGARRARFCTVVLVAWPDGTETVAEGSVQGAIAPAEQGSGGFGYDRLFAPDGLGGRTFAEVGVAEKNRVSHRARALAALAGALGSGHA